MVYGYSLLQTLRYQNDTLQVHTISFLYIILISYFIGHGHGGIYLIDTLMVYTNNIIQIICYVMLYCIQNVYCGTGVNEMYRLQNVCLLKPLQMHSLWVADTLRYINIHYSDLCKTGNAQTINDIKIYTELIRRIVMRKIFLKLK